jgi:hypothetical protein
MFESPREEGDLRWNDKAIAAGAQTERRGGAGPVRALLGGGASPAVLFNPRGTENGLEFFVSYR